MTRTTDAHERRPAEPTFRNGQPTIGMPPIIKYRLIIRIPLIIKNRLIIGNIRNIGNRLDIGSGRNIENRLDNRLIIGRLVGSRLLLINGVLLGIGEPGG
ncbi:hypothetical protein, partial [Saccharopolyspora thermophila]|uniref:hypothetical protein n=1 Tax=Saccharopolyspora thermophila TaxID=89367 RepID=UPI0031F7B282